MSNLFNWIKKLFTKDPNDLDNYDPVFVKDVDGKFVSARTLYDLQKNHDKRKSYIFKDAKTNKYYKFYKGTITPFNYA